MAAATTTHPDAILRVVSPDARSEKCMLQVHCLQLIPLVPVGVTPYCTQCFCIKWSRTYSPSLRGALFNARVISAESDVVKSALKLRR